jgi:preprotein translocase subunit SecE
VDTGCIDRAKEGEVAKNRGGRSTDDEFPDDDAVDAELDDLDEDALDDEPDRDSDRRDSDRSPARTTSRSATARARTAARSKTKEKEKRPGPFGRILLFVREVVAELQKVIWPTRKELLTYTTVVVIFVAIVMTYVALADYGLARLMFLVFGRPDDSPAGS